MSSVVEKEPAATARFADLQRQLPEAPPFVAELRTSAMQRFEALGFPTTREEEWLYTNVAPIARTPFRLPQRPSSRVTEERIATHRLEGSIELVFVNGCFSHSLSRTAAAAGVTALSLATAWNEHPAAVEAHLGRYAEFGSRPFVALNAALVSDGAWIAVADRTVLERPIHLLFIATSNGYPEIASPRVLVVAGPSSQFQLVESYVALERSNYLTNAVVEVVVHENAVVDHTRSQDESTHAFHISSTDVLVAKNGSYTSHSLAFGGGLVRNELNCVLNGEGSECALNGFYALRGTQHVDNHTVIDHVKPHATSGELYKGILADSSRGVFDGKIIVRKEAQKTSSRQANHNLLLSDGAIVDSKPQLEIHADDVKCNHGSTIGQLDADSLFYLRARGIGEQEAKRMMMIAFAGDVLDRLKSDTLRDRAAARIGERFASAYDAGEAQ